MLLPDRSVDTSNQLGIYIYPDDPEQFVRAYLDAMSRADFDAMRGFAADEVIVLAGSTLLDERYGGLGGETGRDVDRTVSRDEWITGYRCTIEQLGGIEDHARELDGYAERVSIVVVQQGVMGFRRTAEELGLDPNDAICTVNPTGDAAVVIISRLGGDRWYVVGEFWD